MGGWVGAGGSLAWTWALIVSSMIIIFLPHLHSPSLSSASFPLYFSCSSGAEAVCDGESALVRAYLEHGANPNAWGQERGHPYPEPALHVAARKSIHGPSRPQQPHHRQAQAPKGKGQRGRGRKGEGRVAAVTAEDAEVAAEVLSLRKEVGREQQALMLKDLLHFGADPDARARLVLPYSCERTNERTNE